MTEAELRLREEIKFLDDLITSLKGRMGASGNAVQRRTLEMFTRLRDRCLRSLSALERRNQEGAAA